MKPWSAFLILLSLCVQGQVGADSSKANTPGTWQAAIIFSRRHGQRVFVGLVSHPKLPARLGSPLDPQTALTTSDQAQFDYEICLVGSSASLRFLYATRQKQVAALTLSTRGAREERRGPRLADAGIWRRLIAQARPSAREHFVIDDPQMIAVDRSVLNSVERLLANSQYVAVCRVVSRIGSVQETDNRKSQNTTYLVAVETYLTLGGEAGDAGPPVLTVEDTGGVLPSTDEQGQAHTGWFITSVPPLCVGDRYILFLAENSASKTFQPTDPLWGKILLRNGVTRTAALAASEVYFGTFKAFHERHPLPLFSPNDTYDYWDCPRLMEAPEKAARAAIIKVFDVLVQRSY